MSTLSISVTKFGSALSFASQLRQSYSVQARASFHEVASCTPCDASATVSFSGHLVARIRLRRSVRSASGKFTRNGRMPPLAPPVCCATAFIDLLLAATPKRPSEPAAALAAAAPQKKRRLISPVLCISNSLGTALPSNALLTLLVVELEQTWRSPCIGQWYSYSTGAVRIKPERSVECQVRLLECSHREREAAAASAASNGKL